MEFLTRIDNDLKEAMKARQADRLNVLRMLKSSLKNVAIELGGADVPLDDATAAAVVRKEVKKRQDAIEGFTKGHRPELAEKEEAELAMLSAYLPEPLTEQELQTLVIECIAESGATSKAQMGAVMKLVNLRAAGRADGKALSAAVSAQLS
ncbi:MAG TPA: GatB/YqeY domain-containing protein [Chthoniobacteraceae bacterium]|jgi:hypothetical protein